MCLGCVSKRDTQASNNSDQCSIGSNLATFHWQTGRNIWGYTGSNLDSLSFGPTDPLKRSHWQTHVLAQTRHSRPLWPTGWILSISVPLKLQFLYNIDTIHDRNILYIIHLSTGTKVNACKISGVWKFGQNYIATRRNIKVCIHWLMSNWLASILPISLVA